MLDWTDRHCRYFFRLMSRHAVLYTEMITTGAVLYGKPAQVLSFNPDEHPVALQLGGSDPVELAQCAEIAESLGYDEINLNVGCPSDRVKNGRFGACLMAFPEQVAECVAAMQNTVSIPVTVKSRIGIDHNDSYEELERFISIIAAGGCRTFIVHARKAWLQGLSPKQNREIPPLRHDLVYQLKADFPNLEIILNGGITRYDQALAHLHRVDGVMLGREIYHNPYFLTQVDRRFYGKPGDAPSRREIVLDLVPYIQRQREQGVRLHHISRHILGLFHGVAGARSWRRYISEHARQPDADEQVILQALKFTD